MVAFWNTNKNTFSKFQLISKFFATASCNSKEYNYKGTKKYPKEAT